LLVVVAPETLDMLSARVPAFAASLPEPASANGPMAECERLRRSGKETAATTAPGFPRRLAVVAVAEAGVRVEPGSDSVPAPECLVLAS